MVDYGRKEQGFVGFSRLFCPLSHNKQTIEQAFHIALMIGIKLGKRGFARLSTLQRTHSHILHKRFQLSEYSLLPNTTAGGYVLGLHQSTTLAHHRSKTHGIVQSISTLQHTVVDTGSLRVAHVAQEAVGHKTIFRLQAFEFFLAFDNSQFVHTLAQHTQGARHITLCKNRVVDS